MISLEFFELQNILIPSFWHKADGHRCVYIYGIYFFVWLELTKKDTAGTNFSTEHSGEKSSIFSLLASEKTANCGLLSLHIKPSLSTLR